LCPETAVLGIPTGDLCSFGGYDSVTVETIHTLTALQSCGRVCIDFRWLL